MSKPQMAGAALGAGTTTAGLASLGAEGAQAGGQALWNTGMDSLAERVVPHAQQAAEMGARDAVNTRVDEFTSGEGIADMLGIGPGTPVMNAIDSVIGAFGMDANSMSVGQKLMLAVSTGLLGGGALTGSGSMAGLGGLGMLLPFLMGQGGGQNAQQQQGPAVAQDGNPAIP